MSHGINNTPKMHHQTISKAPSNHHQYLNISICLLGSVVLFGRHVTGETLKVDGLLLMFDSHLHARRATIETLCVRHFGRISIQRLVGTLDGVPSGIFCGTFCRAFCWLFCRPLFVAIAVASNHIQKTKGKT